MKTVPITGTLHSITFYEDDTIETVRQLIALEVESHPDRLFVELKATLPAGYYSENPSHWTELFYRLSYNGESVTEDALKTYTTMTRTGTGFVPRAITKEEWEQRVDLDPLFTSTADFFEWRLLGVSDVRSMVLPSPPRDVSLRPASIPLLRPQSLFETLHPYPVTDLRVTEVTEDTSDQVKRTFFPFLRPDTPSTIESLRASLTKSQTDFAKLLALPAPQHEQSTFVKAKWYIPFVSTTISAPRARFEQIFYGLTVSKSTPHIAYFTAKTETIRHKLYVEDPTNKVPVLDTSLLRGWIAKTQPQRRKPTLLLYRGTSSTHFDRIAITDTDITVDVRREKSSKANLESLQKSMLKWIGSLDAVTPFVDPLDLNPARWELSELSVVATYAKEIAEFDMRRFQCLQSIFGLQNDVFRLLRAEQTGGDVSPQLLQAYQILNQESAVQTPEYLADELGIPVSDAKALMTELETTSEDINFERSLRAYPTIKFSRKEVLIRFVTTPERTLKYVDLLRYVLTADDSDRLSEVCPRRLEEVGPLAIVPQQEVNLEEAGDVDTDLLALLGLDEETAPAEESAVSNAAPAPRARKLAIRQKTTGTHNYFNTRLKDFDPDTFDQSFYPKKCEKRQQVIALTPADKARIGPEYDYSGAPESERLDLSDPDATVVCPPYWCMRDEIPLREDQLVAGDDGDLRCPKCSGKVRPNDSADNVEFTVIRRDSLARYPDFMKKESTLNKRKVPCCYVQPRSTSETLSKEDEMYIFREDARTLPGLRFAYLSDQLASKLNVKSTYSKTVKKGHLIFGESDSFRIGLGRPSQTLPILLDDATVIKRPKDARENVIRCSFFRTWTTTAPGDSTIDRIVNAIDIAYETGHLTLLQELEYVTSFLKCEVILIDPASEQVLCGFWSDTLGANSRTIAVIGSDILGLVRRKRSGKTYKTEFVVNLRNPPFGATTWPHLLDLHKQACSVGVPTFDDAVAEFQRVGTPTYQVILDPFDRIQAVFLPGTVILPVLPTTRKPFAGVTVRAGYIDLVDADLPSAASQRAFVTDTKHPGFKIRREHRNGAGLLVEYELVSGFRVPVRAEATTAGPVSEVVETIRTADETTLVNGVENEDDKALHSEISYSAEIYEFLMFTLSKDIQEDENLYRSVESRRDTVYKDLSAWFDKNAFEDTTKSHVAFLSKVRTPCGQFKVTTEEGKKQCNDAPLCGVRGNTCNIKVNPIVKKQDVLKRMVKTLRDNDKQRALVLDNRLSPFFSTILYLELPHELITSSL